VEPPFDRRRGRGRRRTDGQDTLAVRGLLHDLGHQLTTLSYLVEAVRGDVDLPGDAGTRLDLLSLEMSRVLEVIAQQVPGRQDEAAAIGPVDLRSLAGQVTQLARVARETALRLRPGPEVSIEASPALLWRVLTNLVDNAARAAGPGGHVEVAVEPLPGGAGAAIEVIDDGPGFGHGPPGTAALGLGVVTTLLESGGGRLDIRDADGGGTWARVVLPGHPPGPGPASLAAGDRLSQ
jgi:signal transduction histidine kinase